MENEQFGLKGEVAESGATHKEFIKKKTVRFPMNELLERVIGRKIYSN